MQNVVRSFVDDARTILAHGPTDDALAQLMARMRLLIRHPTVLEDHEAFLARSATDASTLYADVGRKSEVLYTDETGLTLVRTRFSPDQATPVHSHGTWGVLGVYAGQDLHRSYVRRDSGSGAGTAESELIEQSVLAAGDVALIPRPPQDIHQQQGYGGEPAFELVVFGKHAMVIPRLIFDTATKTAREVVPAQGDRCRRLHHRGRGQGAAADRKSGGRIGGADAILEMLSCREAPSKDTGGRTRVKTGTHLSYTLGRGV